MTKAKWPNVWMMTDERMGDALWPALERLPLGAGVVARHYHAPHRNELVQRIADVARRRGLMLAVAADRALARSVGATLVHNPNDGAGDMPISRSVHSLDEVDAANRAGCALAFVSPMYATRSHPEADALTPGQAKALVDRLACPAIALGGMNEARFAALSELGFYGWAGIDAWIRT